MKNIADKEFIKKNVAQIQEHTVYDLVTLALALEPDEEEMREEILRYALALAVDADKIDEIFVCSAHLAAQIAFSADISTRRKIEAFDTCEIAIERLALAQGRSSEIAIELLWKIIHEREYMEKLRLPLYALLPASKQPDGFADLFGNKKWPERISTRPYNNWIEDLFRLQEERAWEMELEKARFVLEQPPRPDAALTDWMLCTVNHPAYRRAVPHHLSFLYEAKFDSHLLELTHEITHAMSLHSGVGLCLTSLRVATLDVELTLWSLVPNADVNSLLKRIEKEGVAPLEDGDAVMLIRAEQALELTLKAQILQDVWTPWFEGLAIFGEIAADPALDFTGIGAVTECLRNLVDFYPPPEKSGEEIKAAVDQFVSEFESRCSAAIGRLGQARLNTYFRASGTPYLTGYLAVRSVVSAWRGTINRPLTGTEVFGLLLHATRYGTFNAVPDLSLRSDLFESAALKMMCDWACALSQLTCEEIEDFITPIDRNTRGPIFHWDGPRPKRTAPEEQTLLNAQRLVMAECRVEEALSSLTCAEDVKRFKHTNSFTFSFFQEASQVLKASVEKSKEQSTKILECLTRINGLLPIAYTDARFFLNVGQEPSFLWVHLRTTEEHIMHGMPSTNEFVLTISQESGRQLAKAFHRLGKPRLQITRLIDLEGLVFPGEHLLGSHLIAYNYGDWLEIFGANPVVEQALKRDNDYYEFIRNLIRTRISPAEIHQAEHNLIMPGYCGAKRTNEWINRSTQWLFNDNPVSVQNWAEYVRILGDRVRQENERHPRQARVAKTLVTALHGDEEVANKLFQEDFETVTEQIPELREGVVAALFKTAIQPSFASEITEVAARFAANGLDLFSEKPYGWDVHAAIRMTP